MSALCIQSCIFVSWITSPSIHTFEYLFHSPIQKRTATTSPGTSQASPQMVEVRYQVKKGSQHTRKVPITTPSVTKALCSFLHEEFSRFRSFKAENQSL